MSKHFFFNKSKFKLLMKKRFSTCSYFACYLVRTAYTLGHSRTDEYHYDCLSSAGEFQPIASSSSEMSLAMGVGHSDIDTPTDDPKCWSSPAHSCSNVWVTAATGLDGLNGLWMASDWPRNKHTACRVHTTIHIRCYLHFIFLLHSLKIRVNCSLTWAKALVQYRQMIGSALLDNLLFPTASVFAARVTICLWSQRKEHVKDYFESDQKWFIFL